MNNSGNSTKEDADEIGVALGEIEFLDKLSREFFKDKVGYHRIMVLQNILKQFRTYSRAADVRRDEYRRI